MDIIADIFQVNNVTLQKHHHHFKVDHKVFITPNVKPLDASFKDWSMQFKARLDIGNEWLWMDSWRRYCGGS
ncbi:unnamed protein product [Cuscuta campestris]|uniref:Uncharacterized protein n=1 Tax=Cuscuta campestris TaxID=132261 RepID=A0A484LBA8_9ASTE|nr:unnamed protein product [Cuscuta campestris]